MRRIIVSFAALAFMAVTLQGATAATKSCTVDKKTACSGKMPTKSTKPVVKSGSVICPVMGGKVADLKHAKKSVYKGKTYYFCCPDCKTKFDKNPEKYIKPAPKAKAAAADIRCPVTGTKVIDPKTAPKSVYKGKTYYFCCAACKPTFDKNPEKYIHK
jgi:YHS domain-containing protein